MERVAKLSVPIRGEDHWTLPVEGQLVTQLCIDYAITIRLEDGIWDFNSNRTPVCPCRRGERASPRSVQKPAPSNSCPPAGQGEDHFL